MTAKVLKKSDPNNTNCDKTDVEVVVRKSQVDQMIETLQDQEEEIDIMGETIDMLQTAISNADAKLKSRPAAQNLTIEHKNNDSKKRKTKRRDQKTQLENRWAEYIYG